LSSWRGHRHRRRRGLLDARTGCGSSPARGLPPRGCTGPTPWPNQVRVEAPGGGRRESAEPIAPRSTLIRAICGSVPGAKAVHHGVVVTDDRSAWTSWSAVQITPCRTAHTTACMGVDTPRRLHKRVSRRRTVRSLRDSRRPIPGGVIPSAVRASSATSSHSRVTARCPAAARALDGRAPSTGSPGRRVTRLRWYSGGWTSPGIPAAGNCVGIAYPFALE
jgi:hypothetical protein